MVGRVRDSGGSMGRAGFQDFDGNLNAKGAEGNAEGRKGMQGGAGGGMFQITIRSESESRVRVFVFYSLYACVPRERGFMISPG